MREIAISNLAFGDKSFEHTLSFLQDNQIKGMELAPTLAWDDPSRVPKKDKEEFCSLLSDYDLSVVALQSLLYNKPQLQLFKGSESQKILLDYLKEIVNLCAELGGRSLSFGSWRNRQKGRLELNEAISSASPFFYTLAEYAKTFNIILCFEPIPSTLGCDFINNTEECLQLIESVGHPHFKILLDTGTLILNNEDCENVIQQSIHHIGHIHINDPQLYPPSTKMSEHPIIASTLRSTGYSGWLTLEFLNYYTSLEQDVMYGLDCYK
jgi:D-psicose/D-tagatose/L-ribulose 3-epimerase